MDASDATTLHVQRAVAGEMGSLDWIVRHFSPLLLAQARYRISRHLQGTHDPEDLVQRTWVICLDRIGRIEPRDGRYTPVLLRYLTSTLLQTYRNLLRSQSSRPAPAKGTAGDSSQVPADPSDHVTGVVTNAIKAEAKDAVSLAIEAMPAADKEIIVLRGLEQMSYALIAAKLDVSEGALKVRYHRALKRLRDHLPEDLAEALDES